MIKKEVTYTDFNDEEQTDILLFHLSKADLVQLQMEEGGAGFGDYIQQIVDAENSAEIWRIFKKILRMSYGKKSSDGKRFIKNEDLWVELESSEAYSTLVMDLMTDPAAMAEFIAKLVPQNLDADVAKITAGKGAASQAAPAATDVPSPKPISRREATEMTGEELQQKLASGEYVLAGE